VLIAEGPCHCRWVQCGPDRSRNGAEWITWQRRMYVEGSYRYIQLGGPLPLRARERSWLAEGEHITCKHTSTVVDVVAVADAYAAGLRGRLPYADVVKR